jgi:four helix bundle protein
MTRSAGSVGANIAEAWGRDTHADRRRTLFLARGSACELEHWVDQAARLGLPLPSNAANEAREVSRMLNGLIRRWS